MNTGKHVRWRRSSYSGNAGANCVEVAPLAPSIGVRDSKIDGSPIVTTSVEAWATFLGKLR